MNDKKAIFIGFICILVIVLFYALFIYILAPKGEENPTMDEMTAKAKCVDFHECEEYYNIQKKKGIKK